MTGPIELQNNDMQTAAHIDKIDVELKIPTLGSERLHISDQRSTIIVSCHFQMLLLILWGAAEKNPASGEYR